MPAMIWDSTSQAFKEAENPKIWNESAQAFVDSEGKVYNGNEWVDILDIIRSFTLDLDLRVSCTSPSIYNGNKNLHAPGHVSYNKVNNTLSLSGNSAKSETFSYGYSSGQSAQSATINLYQFLSVTNFKYDNMKDSGGMLFSFDVSYQYSLSGESYQSGSVKVKTANGTKNEKIDKGKQGITSTTIQTTGSNTVIASCLKGTTYNGSFSCQITGVSNFQIIK